MDSALRRTLESSPRSVLILVFAAVLAANGCAINPVSGDSEVVLTSVEEEKRIGAEAAKQVAASMGILPDSEVTRYVKDIGNRLAAHSPRQDVAYEFYVVDMKEPNAFALPAGYVYVSRGLLLLANSEDALAGAIGHEIGHVAARHAVQRITRAAPIGILSGITAGVVSIVSPALGQGVARTGSLANEAILAPYGRDQERESDKVGQELAATSGWAPEALANLLDSLGREQELHEEGRTAPSFLSTHPSSAERVATTRAFAETLQPAATAPLSASREAFLRRLDGLVVGESAGGGIFVEETQFLHPDLDFKLRFPSGWTVQNGQAFVGALAPSQDAAIVLELERLRGSPTEVAAATLSEERLNLGDVSSLTIGGLPAAQVSGRDRGKGIVMTWIEHGETMFRITGVGPARRYPSDRPVFTSTADSFAPLSPSDRSQIRETRVRLYAARDGETLSTLVERVGGEGEPEFIAVVNGIDVNTPLEAGQLLKIPIKEPYSGSN